MSIVTYKTPDGYYYALEINMPEMPVRFGEGASIVEAVRDLEATQSRPRPRRSTGASMKIPAWRNSSPLFPITARPSAGFFASLTHWRNSDST
jgi:hypothetical protein